MLAPSQLGQTTDSKLLRQEAGLWLKQLRETRKLTQRELAERVNINYYTFISQIEAGKGRVPPESYQLWADALGVERVEFVKRLLAYYDPFTYRALFADETGAEILAIGR
ncbi:helix-turn-helix domain-containing protein [Oceanibaculum pacificum]|uniref:Cro/Cl family transcriptional regulator n=1 Tax=Oceanibaculum pacificum TaxID=580166 RepID=A0A154VYN7_9PROT|nr:helix-turn-helix transcriptional regulator [Oceanibaculum pacificum]KZD06452.1 Cro/Cl family transcriptional regulator [Oceanibaculum pacificum]